MRTVLLCAALLVGLGDGAFAQYFGGGIPYGDYNTGVRGMRSQEATAIAEYWIHSYLRRYPEHREIGHWAGQLMRRPAPHVLASLLASDEYYNYAGGTQHGFARQLIEDVGHHQPSRYELEDLLRASAGASRQQVAFSMLRRFPRNWWPGPAATPPKELQHLYGPNHGRHNAYYGWR
jgi:hypothetical protein